MKLRAVQFVWTDEGVMKPLPRFKVLCDKQYTVGEEYTLTPPDNRSLRSLRHYMVAVKEGWENLAEEWDGMFESPEHLRKWCLVWEGYATKREIHYDTPKDALASKELIKGLDEYVVAKVKDNVLMIFRPKSQSGAAMQRQEFQDSKERVLARIATMARTTVPELKKRAAEIAKDSKERVQS